MVNLLPLLSAFSATDAPTSDRSKRTNGLTDFPSEEPSERELYDWLKENRPTMMTLFGAYLRGETPPHLIQYERADDAQPSR